MEKENAIIKNTNKKDGIKAFWVVFAISLIISAIFTALIPTLLIVDYSGYGVAPPLNDTLQFFYQTNGFLGLFYLMWLIGAAALKRRTKIFTDILFWGILIFAILFASNFASNIYYLNKIAPEAGLGFAATYAPTLCLIASMIAFFSNADKTNMNKANKFISGCAVASVFMTAYYCFRACAENLPQSAVQQINLYMVVTGAVNISLINIMLSIITHSRRIYDRIVNGLTDKEAAIEELAQDTAETMAENIKDEIELLEEAAEVLDKGNTEAENNK